MRKRRITKGIAVILCLLLALSVPIDAYAATKNVTTTAKRENSKAVKTGKTVVTVQKGQVTNATGYIKFKATKTKTYKFTLNNVRKSGKKSSNDIIVTHVNFYTPTEYGGFSNVAFKQNGKSVYTLYLCSAKSWSVSSTKSPTAYTAIKSRTASIKLQKGQTIYLGLSNTHTYKLCYDLNIK